MAKFLTKISVNTGLKSKTHKLFTELQEIPNTDTIAAMREAEEVSQHPERYKRYISFSELLNDLKMDSDED